ncbi:hypothetical protein [Neobacillus mesonae]|uniref:hypothetical protein n=1 Tax=Neobacillus mesonae TaxID=1193713 RepID=UPI00203FD186|nr:hypothetical protein [Neobacillus mesonae]MCM3569927.1 hypothetical protein [Neobacillus mesonae]
MAIEVPSISGAEWEVMNVLAKYHFQILKEVVYAIEIRFLHSLQLHRMTVDVYYIIVLWHCSPF